MTWLDAVLLLSALAALAGVAAHNATAVALLVSFVLSEAMCRLGAPFNVAVWMTIDVAVATFIIRPGMKRRDWLILALFPAAWVFYVLQPHRWAEAVIGIVAVQMFLTFPIRRLAIPTLRHWAKQRPHDPFQDLRAYA